MTGTWRAYYPEDGETADDAREVRLPAWSLRKIYDAEDAASVACEMDYSERDGWERGMGESFPIVVIAPDGTETRWQGVHEATVQHLVDEDNG